MKKLIAFILMLTSIVVLFACGNKKTTPPSEDPEISFIDKNGDARFVVIYDVKSSDTVKNVSQLIGSEFRKSFGKVFRVTSSSVIKDGKDSYEILVGSTEREESVSLSEGIAEMEYRIKVMGKKIVIVGGSDIALSRGVGAFLAAINYDEKTVSKTLDIKGTVGGHSEMLVGMANQTSKCVEVYDISGGRMDATSLVWTSNPTPGISGFKFRSHPTYGEVVLVTVGTHARMVSYETKEVLWSTNNTPDNSHSAELLPNGVMAVGGTVGHDIHFYNLNSDDPTKIRFEMPHHDAHGLLWDPKNEILWGVGSNLLAAYRVTLNDDGSIDVIKDEELSITSPEGGLHDLQPYFGNDDWLLVTTSKNVYIYDKVNKTFTEALDGVANATKTSVKGVGRFLNGDMIYIYPDGLHELWNSTILNYVQADENRFSVQINSNMGRFYKCRVWYSNYQ